MDEYEYYRQYTSSATNTVAVTAEGWAHYKREKAARERRRQVEAAVAEELAAQMRLEEEAKEETERLLLRRQLELEQSDDVG